jgi:hypothetical protein
MFMAEDLEIFAKLRRSEMSKPNESSPTRAAEHFC